MDLPDLENLLIDGFCITKRLRKVKHKVRLVGVLSGLGVGTSNFVHLNVAWQTLQRHVADGDGLVGGLSAVGLQHQLPIALVAKAPGGSERLLVGATRIRDEVESRDRERIVVEV